MIKKFESYLGFGYYINACSICNKILTIMPGDNPDGIYTREQLKEKNEDYLIEWIRRTPEKAITFGNKTNATSKRIDKELFDRLVKEFPAKSNI